MIFYKEENVYKVNETPTYNGMCSYISNRAWYDFAYAT